MGLFYSCGWVIFQDLLAKDCGLLGNVILYIRTLQHSVLEICQRLVLWTMGAMCPSSKGEMLCMRLLVSPPVAKDIFLLVLRNMPLCS